ncbi:hypothetical protein Tter_2625 [Thermobaculum terrenum ATCC BAA-798]|uniref:Alkaline shock response membrane anchor protein AmaP n=1 Tax=Thermobaculum terrenum (strain ATCC BAA-798 / CCMEE 7001 / YNP1) TaxID=525904 RepID=D1CIE2_THET1|nr:hypothetical protein [Thermobaculum terrenum]ACZ43513.1 hypothetical protein Tter_2625 [Thermobaculum terrenum ATCC BAA-798]
MNAFNRVVILLLALLVGAASLLLLLVNFGVISPSDLNYYTGYRSAVDAFSRLSPQGVSPASRAIIAIVALVVAVIGLALLLRELSVVRNPREVVVDDTPGRELRISSGAVAKLAGQAARAAGASSPRVSLRWHRGAFEVRCDVACPMGIKLADYGEGIKTRVTQELQLQRVPVRRVLVVLSEVSKKR